MNEKGAKIMIFSDATVVAFLTLKPSLTVKPQRQPSGRVSFEVSGENIEGALAELFGNVPVPVSDYIKALKNVKSMIFSLKG